MGIESNDQYSSFEKKLLTRADELTKTPFKKSEPPRAWLSVSIPASVAPYADDIRRFVDAMVYKLERNAHKGRWEDLDLSVALDRLVDEVNELRAEIGGNSTKTVLEAADVANFAMIIASIATERGK